MRAALLPCVLTAALVAVAGCSGAPGDPALDDALGDPLADGGSPDGVGTEGGRADGIAPGDAAGGPDGDASAGDAGAPCMVDGIPGACVAVASCVGDRVATPGHCPGAKDVQCCTPRVHPSDAGGEVGPDTRWPADTGGWCPTDPGARPNAGLLEDSYDAHCARGMIRVGAFCVDRYEGAIVVTATDGTESSWTPYYPPPSDRPYRAVSIRGAVPQGYISGVEAEKACLASGKRLCSNAEWLRACQGPSATTFPYGNTREPGVCNDARTPHPAIQCFATDASWIWSEIGWPGINQQASTVERAGARTGCVTAEGAYDMMGNLHEWVKDATVNFRGGFYVDTVENGPGCLYQTTAHTFGHWDYSTGFRCCADPLP